MLRPIFYLTALFGFCCLSQAQEAASARYSGSAACKTCHASHCQRWSKTRMANVVLDPREHPDVIIPDLSKPNPVFPFSAADVAFV